jgi:hypothetical protein
MSQYVSDMTPSALVILIFVSQIILVAGESTVGLLERKLLVISGFWLQTNQHLYASKSHQEKPQTCCHGPSNNSEGLEKIGVIEGSQNHPTRMSPRSSHEISGRTSKPLGDLHILHRFRLCTTLTHPPALWYCILMPKCLQTVVLSWMWGPGCLIMARPVYCIFVWGENAICPNYWSSLIHNF